MESAQVNEKLDYFLQNLVSQNIEKGEGGVRILPSLCSSTLGWETIKVLWTLYNSL